jgi:hypothetical protein
MAPSMSEHRVIVVGETRSLGTAVAELFIADGIEVVLVEELSEGERWAAKADPGDSFVLVAAANGPRCESVDQWAKSTLRHCDLVVVGAREVDRSYRPRLHLVPLPLEPRRLLGLVRALLGLPLHLSSGAGDPSEVVNLRARIFGERRSDAAAGIVHVAEPVVPGA